MWHDWLNILKLEVPFRRASRSWQGQMRLATVDGNWPIPPLHRVLLPPRQQNLAPAAVACWKWNSRKNREKKLPPAPRALRLSWTKWKLMGRQLWHSSRLHTSLPKANLGGTMRQHETTNSWIQATHRHTGNYKESYNRALSLPTYVHIWAPVKILYFWVVAIVMVIAFGGPYRFPGFCGNQHIRDPTWSQNPFLNRFGNESRSCFVGSGASATLHFMFLSFCIHLHASSFIFLSFACIFLSLCIHLFSCSFHAPVMFLSFVFISLSFPSFLSFSFQCAFMSFHLPFIAFSFNFAFMSFHFLSRVMEMALWLGQETECNKWLSLSYR